MAYYSLKVVETEETLSGVVAPNREVAIAEFGDKLGKRLTLDEQDFTPPYLMDEWFDQGVHWVRPHIPVFDA